MQVFSGLYKGCGAWLAMCIMVATYNTGCTKTDIQYGSQFTGDQYTQIVMSDTFTIETGTIGLDSFVTSATGTALVGSYKDDVFGQVNAESYFQFQPPSLFDKSTIYDSLELVMPLTKKIYGDSTQPLQVNVYQLATTITKADNASFYNNNQVAHQLSPIGSKLYNLYPSQADTLFIRLDDNIGRTLLSLLQSDNNAVASADNFVSYFKGLCVSATQGNAFVLGFKDSIEIRLHYKNTEASLPVSKTASFSIYDYTKQFNHISVDRTGTALAGLGVNGVKYLSSKSTGNEAFLQSATGSVVKIRIPYIRNLLQLPDFVKISSAVLTIHPVNGTYSGYYTLPDSLVLSTTDKNNGFGTNLTYTDNSIQYGSFTRDYLYEENTGYKFDLTSYLTEQIAIATDNENGVILSPSATNFGNTFQRVVVGDQQNKTSRISLQVYYLSVQ